ncbi:cell division protein ZapA [Levilactobacillus brevis]|jgi:cell division protein ZapA|uniref:Stimulator of FtsZ polymerization and component of cell-division Z-ring n=3 Tax=Levilactobacillus brevis TaxID=1580 RepID=Q03R47_LEVBA|nr:cell division protein ZapA [Levilactobacillus brevis]MBL3537582.1 cell division protein ZapA [Lactobacillus sp. GPR40-2]MBL3630740.1 cell division protein ZapA [Lactobacillus sp. GPB7-4]ABJ64325.1 Stimulator of FtsZ polymerization and component of cell-division Z-ring [Levilactobacillus brevis ATCC 367]AJA79359.1 cell division protein FtsZ [Levilactobacillus brevis BSO 464]ANN48759.1 cell division protein FtsZ [Levilactobacillus brevis]
MTEDTHRFKAVIAGKTYTIVGQATDEHMRAVTEVLNEQFTQLKQLSPNMSKEDAAILMAFNAVSDQLKMVAAQDDTAATATDETTETED